MDYPYTQILSGIDALIQRLKAITLLPPDEMELLTQVSLKVPQLTGAMRDYLNRTNKTALGENATMKNIKKSQLMDVIKTIVRESLDERKDKWIQRAVDPSHKGYCTPMTKSTCTPARKALAKRFKKGIENESQGGTSIQHDYEGENTKMSQMEAGLTSEENDNQRTPLDDIVAIVLKRGVTDKSKLEYLVTQLYLQQIGNHPDKDAISAAIDKQLPQAAKVDEASYKVVAPRQARVQKDNQARQVQKDPELTEASYKVVSPNSNDTSKENKAREMQTDPTVNESASGLHGMLDHAQIQLLDRILRQSMERVSGPEETKSIQLLYSKLFGGSLKETAYKVQGPSYKTFKDSPKGDTAYKDDPKNR